MFEPGKLYCTKSPELLDLAPYSVWADWRSRRMGPTYIRFGRRILYRGEDLNSWLEANTVHAAPAQDTKPTA